MFKLSLSNVYKQISSVTLICVILWGCGSTPATKNTLNSNIIMVGETTHSFDYYNKLSTQASGLNLQAYRLLAVRAALQDEQIEIADSLLQKLSYNSMLSDSHQLEFQLLTSLRFSIDNNLEQAIAVLTPDPQWQVPSIQLVNYHKQHADFLLKNQQPILAIASLVQGELATTEIQQTLEFQMLIWQTYQTLTLEDLNSIDTNAYTMEQNGWHELAILFKNSLHSPESLADKLASWKLKFPQHLAINNLPSQVLEAINVKPFKPNKIAIILPLTGRYARLGEAVQNGLTSNLLATKSAQEVITFDSNELGAVAAYQKAIELNSEFVIGPLLKENVEQVNTLELQVPTLFLNTPIEINRLTNQFYFSLDKESEAIQGANYIFELGKKRPVIVAPDNLKGHQMAQLFQKQWLTLHDENINVNNIESIFFTTDKLLKRTIEQLFETNKSQARINLTRLLVDSKMKSSTRSRRDIDAIYLVANPKQTAMLMPSVKVTVSDFAEQVPVFVGSSGNNYKLNDNGLTHLNQLNVSEIPWFVTASDLPVQEITTLWPKINQSQLRLFAMGYDALGLISQLAQMELFPQYSREGLTGNLTLDQNGKIQRQLTWAKFEKGRLEKTQ